jgi:hypothetical protein
LFCKLNDKSPSFKFFPHFSLPPAIDQLLICACTTGLPTVCCILPQEAIFHYDIRRVGAVAAAVLQTADEILSPSSPSPPNLVVHTFSNNGAAVYQQCYQQFAQRQQLNRIQVRFPF